MKVYLDKHSTETCGKVRRHKQLDSLKVLEVLENTKTRSFGKHAEQKGGIMEVYLWKLYIKFTLENLQCVKKQ